MSTLLKKFGAGSFTSRLLTIAAATLIVIAVACSGNKTDKEQSNTTSESNVSETMKNPLADNPGAVATGKILYAKNCASCHGDGGEGDGDFAASLPTKPSKLTAGDAVSAADGKIYLVIRNGKMNAGKVTMAPARGVTDGQIWQIVSYVRELQNQARNKKED